MIARWYNINSIEYVIACAYASGKGRIFEIFYGWRTVYNNDCKMVFSRKDWENIDELIRYYNRFCKGE